jgi:hypothetical protein
MTERGAARRAALPPGAARLTAGERALLAYLRVARRLYVPRAATALLADAHALLAQGLAARAPTTDPASPFGETFVPTAAGLTGPPPERWPPGPEAGEAEP